MPDPKPPPPEDRIAYRIAVGAVGLALVAFLIGAAIIAAGGKPVPTQYWTTGSAISGALLGILAPSPTPQATLVKRESRVGKIVSELGAAAVDLWKNRGLLILLVVFAASVILGVTSSSPELLGVAAGAGGALVGLLAPTPSSGGGGGGGTP